MVKEEEIVEAEATTEVEEVEGVARQGGQTNLNIQHKILGIKPPGTLICPHLGCVKNTGNLGNPVSYAWSHGVASGRTSSNQSKIEGPTSSTKKKMTVKSIVCCTTIRRKYTH